MERRSKNHDLPSLLANGLNPVRDENVHHHSVILCSCKFVGASFHVLFLIVKKNMKTHSTSNVIGLEGRGRWINKAHRARAISSVQLPTAEAFALMSHPLGHFSPAQCLIFIRLDLRLFSKSVWLSRLVNLYRHHCLSQNNWINFSNLVGEYACFNN